MTEHPARIIWAPPAQRGTHRLPSTLRYTHIARFADDRPGDDAWSVVCRFEVPPSEQDGPSAAFVRFLMPEAPHARLAPGTSFHLFEGPTEVATVEVFG
jgi:hypothetical protein